eukprot:COSAG06_NODE_4967_length_3824_cov_7.590604_2_plen_323_part_00
MGCGTSNSAQPLPPAGQPAEQRAAAAATTAGTAKSDEGLEVNELHIMAEHNHHRQVRAYVAAGYGVVDVRDGVHAITPLMLAAAHGHVETMMALLEMGANINASDNDGATVLMWAIGVGSEACVELLKAAGADLNAVDNAGLTADDYEERNQAAVTAAAAGAAAEEQEKEPKGEATAGVQAVPVVPDEPTEQERGRSGTTSSGSVPPQRSNTIGSLLPEDSSGSAGEAGTERNGSGSTAVGQSDASERKASALVKTLSYHGAASFMPDGGGFAKGARRPRLSSGLEATDWMSRKLRSLTVTREAAAAAAAAVAVAATTNSVQ